MSQSFAALAPGLTFIHSFPGTVITPFAANSENPFVRALAPVLNLALRPFARSRAEAAEYLWHGIFSLGEGAFRTGPDGEDLGDKNRHGTEEQKKALWDHTYSLTNISQKAGD